MTVKIVICSCTVMSLKTMKMTGVMRIRSGTNLKYVHMYTR